MPVTVELALPDRGDVLTVASAEDATDNREHRPWDVPRNRSHLLGAGAVGDPREEPAASRRADLAERASHRPDFRCVLLLKIDGLELGLLVLEVRDGHRL